MKDRARIIEAGLRNGITLLVQVTALSDNEHIDYTWHSPTFRTITNTIEGIAAEISASLEKTSSSRASIRFGLEFAIEQGTLVPVLVNNCSAANLDITLEWEANQTATYQNSLPLTEEQDTSLPTQVNSQQHVDYATISDKIVQNVLS